MLLQTPCLFVFTIVERRIVALGGVVVVVLGAAAALAALARHVTLARLSVSARLNVCSLHPIA